MGSLAKDPRTPATRLCETDRLAASIATSLSKTTNAPSTDFTQGSVHRHIVRLSAFLSLGYMSWVITSMLEAVYLGMLSTNALAALGFIMPVTMVMMSVANGLGIGASSVIARKVGEDDFAAVRRLCTHSMLLGVLIISGLGILGFTLSTPLFRLMGAPDDVLVLIEQYTQIWFVGAPFFATSTIATNLLRATGHASVPGIVMALGSTLQVIFAPILIFGWLGIPALGIRGAAIAFLIGGIVPMVISFYWLVHRERLLAPSLTDMVDSWRSILHVGLPSMATSLVSPVASGIITRLLASHGAAVVAGFSIAMRADFFIMMILMATASAIGPFVGMNWGAGRYDRVKTAIQMVNGFCVVWGVACFLFMLLFAETIVEAINDDPDVIRSATLYLLIVPFSIGFMGLQSVATSTFNALGKPIPSLILSMARMAVIYVPLAIIAEALYGYIGIFFATSLTSVIVGIWAFLWLRRMIDTPVEIDGLEKASAGATSS